MRITALILIATMMLSAAKIKDIVEVVGVRDNQLVGYGLVVGLNGTGDGTSSDFTTQSLGNMLESMNVKIDSTAIKPKNIAAVIVTAKLDSFSRQGDKININISSIGDAKSLQGGTLVMTALKGVDGKIYAIAQGSVSIGGKNERGAAGLNHATSGLVFRGATVEREINYDLYSKERGRLSLKQGSFANAISIQNSLNAYFKNRVAVAIDPKTINITRPKKMSMIEFIAMVENIDVSYVIKERIVINERTGTIVAGVNINVSPVVVTHGEITIKIEETDDFSSAGEKDIKLDKNVLIGISDSRIKTKKGSSTVANIARSLQKLGATPKDLISILESMKEAGAIKADLEVI